MNAKEQKAQKPDTIRINKYLSDAGICSRREADKLIEAGRIYVDGKKADIGERVSEASVILLDGKRIEPEEKKVLLLFHKPRGIVCSTKKQRTETTVTEYINYPVRVYPVGRLDKESEGLLLLTNQGELVNKIMRAGNYHEKEYQVRVNRAVTEEFLRGMRKGVPILDTVTRPCKVKKTGTYTFEIILTQGLNRQIRRMCEYFGYTVTSLKRVRIMNLTLQGLESGKYREITHQEWKELEAGISKSSSETVTRAGGRNAEGDRGDERAGRKTSPGIQSVLSGRQGDHEQPRVRRSVRSSGTTGKGERNCTGRISHRQRRV